MVIADDNRRYWRRTFFPFYKHNRKKARENIKIDWNVFFNYVEKIKTEIQENLPYKYLDIDGAEADDIIATLVKNISGPIIIISTDKDMIQLHRENVKQYDLIRDRWITHDDPKTFLFEHIIKGDAGDGIPNIATNDNCFAVGERQRKITTKIMDSVIDIDKQPDHRLYRNYIRNKTLIDLSMIPKELQEEIMHKYSEIKKPARSKMMMYFASKELSVLATKINDF